jgi:O-antigen ligase
VSQSAPWPHNLYLEILVSQGIFGLIALSAILAGALRLGWVIRKSKQEHIRFYGIGVMSGLLGFCFAGVYELSFIRLWVTIVMFVYVATLTYLYRIYLKHNSDAAPERGQKSSEP